MDIIEAKELAEHLKSVETPNSPQYVKAVIILAAEVQRLQDQCDKWKWGYTKASNECDEEREKWIIAEREVATQREELGRLNKEHGEWQTKIESRLEQAEIRVQRAEVASTKVDAQREELERLREALKIYADKQNWWQTDPTSIEWQGDPEEFPWDIARRALAGGFTGQIEMVKLYPGLTPEEISNDYKEARGALTGEG